MTKTITCDKCGGKGQMPLHPALSETLAFVPNGKGISTAELSRLMPSVDAKAQSNRLDRLHDLNLVDRERMGKFWRYTRATSRAAKRKGGGRRAPKRQNGYAPKRSFRQTASRLRQSSVIPRGRATKPR